MSALTWAVAKPRPGHRARRCLPLVLAATLALPAALAAHEVRPAYLEVTEVSAGRFEVLWKQPILPDADPGLVLRLPIAPRFPAHCRESGRALPDLTAAALIERWTLTCGDAGLTGAEVSIDFIERIRPEARFDSVEALIEQMDKDVEQCRGILAAEAPR